MRHQVTVSVVYAEKQQQWIHSAEVARGTNAAELVELSGFLSEIPSLSGKTVDDLELAIYAQKIDHDYLLEEGDRVEIIRPLTADPKVVRREMAKLGKTIGKQRDS